MKNLILQLFSLILKIDIQLLNIDNYKVSHSNDVISYITGHETMYAVKLHGIEKILNWNGMILSRKRIETESSDTIFFISDGKLKSIMNGFIKLTELPLPFPFKKYEFFVTPNILLQGFKFKVFYCVLKVQILIRKIHVHHLP